MGVRKRLRICKRMCKGGERSDPMVSRTPSPPHAPSYCIHNTELCFLHPVYPLQKVAERHAGSYGGIRRRGEHNRSATPMHGRGIQMTEDGILGIVRCGTTYQVRYASYNPCDLDRPPYQCAPTRAPWSRGCATAGWSPGIFIKRVQNCGKAGLRPCPSS